VLLQNSPLYRWGLTVINPYNDFYGSKIPFLKINIRSTKLHGLGDLIPMSECTEWIHHTIMMTTCPTPSVHGQRHLMGAIPAI